MRGKLHPTQKAQRLHEIMIEVHTDVNEYVVDLFAGAGTTAFAAKKLGRKFVVIEKDEKMVDDIVNRLSVNVKENADVDGK
jgi:DNA modification methylase